MSGRRRRSYENGHQPKFLIVVDGTEECDKAVHFASRRAVRTNSGLIMLAVVDPAGFHEWLGVGELIQQEAIDSSFQMLEKAALRAHEIAGITPQLVVRTGARAEQIQALIEEDEDISFLVLAASSNAEGPGPLVTTLVSKGSGAFPVPIVIVPGGMAPAEIDALA